MLPAAFLSVFCWANAATVNVWLEIDASANEYRVLAECVDDVAGTCAGLALYNVTLSNVAELYNDGPMAYDEAGETTTPLAGFVLFRSDSGAGVTTLGAAQNTFDPNGAQIVYDIGDQAVDLTALVSADVYVPADGQVAVPVQLGHGTFTGDPPSITNATFNVFDPARDGTTQPPDTVAILDPDIVGVEYTLTVSVQGQGTTTPAAGDHTYDEGVQVAILAAAADGWHFVRWQGDVSATSAAASVTMNADKAVTAVFEEDAAQYALTVQVQGQGTTTPAAGQHTYDDGTVVPLSAAAADGWHFVRWQGDVAGTSPSSSITISSNKSVTAVFEQDAAQYTLTVNVQGQGATTPAAGQHTYDEGAAVPLTATPAGGWHFVRWEGDASGAQESTQVTMDSAMTVTAVFERDTAQYALTVNVQGQGTTTPAAGQHTYDQGAQVNLGATPAQGWHFVRWEGDVSGVNPNVGVTMDSSKSVTAVFEQDAAQYTLTVNVQGDGTTDPNAGQHSYDANAAVEVAATAADGWHFVRWQGDATGTAPTLTVTMDRGKSVTAVFEQDAAEYVLTVNVQGSGSTNPVPGQHSYADGTEVIVAATPVEGWHFVRWEGDLTGATATASLTMDASQSITAVFEQDAAQYTLTVNVQGQGTTAPAAGQHAYDSGTEVALSAAPAEDWEFIRWEGDISATDPNTTVTMNAGKSVTAVFQAEAVDPNDPNQPSDPNETNGDVPPIGGCLMTAMVVGLAVAFGFAMLGLYRES